MQWLKATRWLIPLVVLGSAAAGGLISSAPRAGSVIARPAASAKNAVAAGENGGSALAAWDWEWQGDLGPALSGRPTHLR